MIASPPQQRFRNSRRFYLPFPSTEPIRDSPCWPFSEGLQPSHHWPLARCRFNSARHPLRKAIQQHKYSASSCIHSASCIELRSSLRRKTELLPSLGSRPSGSRYLCRRVLLGHIPPTGFFSQNPPTEKVSANAVSERTLRSSIGRSELWLCQMLFAPAAAARLFLVAHIKCNDGTSCSRSRRGRATRGTLFVRCRTLFSPHYAGHGPILRGLKVTAHRAPISWFTPL